MAARTVRFELDPRSIGWALAAAGAVWLLIQLWTVLVIVVIALILVGTLKPIVQMLERRGLGRGVALALIFVGMVVVFVGLVLLTVPPLVSQLADVLRSAPATKERVAAWLDQYEGTASLAASLRQSNSNALFTHASGYVLQYSAAALVVMGYGLTTIVLAFYLLADAKRTQGALFAVVPRHYHLRLSRILFNLETIVGGYVRGQVITSVAISAFTFALLTVFGVHNALALAVFAGFVDVIPFVGGLLATVPAVLFALSRGLTTAIVIAVVLFLYQELENRVLIPRVYGRVLRLPPAAVLLALLIGGTLMGIIGALIALPIAAGLQMIARELRVAMPGDDTDAPAVRARDQLAEEAYARRSAGTAPSEAGVIAAELAEEIRAEDAAVETEIDPPPR